VHQINCPIGKDRLEFRGLGGNILGIAAEVDDRMRQIAVQLPHFQGNLTRLYQKEAFFTGWSLRCRKIEKPVLQHVKDTAHRDVESEYQECCKHEEFHRLGAYRAGAAQILRERRMLWVVDSAATRRRRLAAAKLRLGLRMSVMLDLFDNTAEIELPPEPL